MQEQLDKGQLNKTTRLVHLDLLRILACFSVVMLHCAAQYWYSLPVDSTDWLICNAYDAVVRFGVPVFVMISGMLFLGREGDVDIKRLYSRNIWRLAIIYVLWSLVYNLFSVRDVIGTEGFSWGAFFDYLLVEGYHLWYLPMLMGIYVLLPILKSWVDHAEKRQLQYFLILFAVFQVLVSTVKAVNPPAAIDNALEVIDVPMVCSYVGYFILGYYVNRYELTTKAKRWIYGAGICSVAAVVIASTLLSRRQGSPNGELFDSYGIFTFLISLSLTVLFCDKVAKVRFSPKATKIIGAVSADTLGIYLMHLLPLNLLPLVGVTTMQLGEKAISPALGIPLVSLFCFAVCVPVAAVLRRIPFIGKYIC